MASDSYRRKLEEEFGIKRPGAGSGSGKSAASEPASTSGSGQDQWKSSYRGRLEQEFGIKSGNTYAPTIATVQLKYGGYGSEENYIRQSEEAREQRMQRYLDNQSRLSALEAERDSLRQQSSRPASGYLTGGTSITSSPYAAAQQQRDTRSEREIEIDREIASIKADMLKYERGEEGYTSKVVDDYYDYRLRPDFTTGSANRDFANPTREELGVYGTMSDSSTWHYDVDGRLLDMFGNMIDPSRTSAAGDIIHPEAGNYVIQDRLGLFMSANDHEILEATGTVGGTEGEWERVIKDGVYGSWKYLTEDEVSIYYYLLNTSGRATADKYLDDMRVELNRRETTAQTEGYAKNLDDASLLEKIGLSIATTPAQFGGAVTGFVDDAIQMLKGETINPYSAAHSGIHFSNTIREEQAAEIVEATGGWEIPWLGFNAGDIYQAGMSILDMSVGSMLGGTTYSVLMGMNSATNEATRLYQQGASNEQIAAGAMLAGAAEMVFEKYSIEKLINLPDADTKFKMIMNALVQGGIEASEEGATEIANTLTNIMVMGSESDWAKLVEENDGDYGKAFMSKVRDTINAMLAGAISGSFSAGGHYVGNSIANKIQDNQTGRDIVNAFGGVDSLRKLAEEVAGVVPQDTKARLTEQSNKLQEVHTSESASNRSKAKAAGTLHRSITNAIGAQNKADIVKALEAEGITGKKATLIAEAVTAKVAGRELSDAQERLLKSVAQNEGVQKALKETAYNPASAAASRATMVKAFQTGVALDKVKEVNTLYDAVNKMVSEAKSVAKKQYEVSEDGKMVNAKTNKVMEPTGIAQTKDGTYKIADKGAVLVDSSDVRYESHDQGVVFESFLNLGSDFAGVNNVIANMDIHGRNTLLTLYDPAVNPDGGMFVNGVLDAFFYGHRGVDLSAAPKGSPINKLTEKQRQIAWETGRAAGEKATAEGQNRIDEVYAEAQKVLEQTGKKKGTYHASLEAGISPLRLTPEQKVVYGVADEIAQGIQTNIRVYNGTDTAQGFYNHETGEIMLNLNAATRGREAIMAFALAHEIVHRSKHGALAKYEAFSAFLLKEYGKQGSDIEAMIQEQLDAVERYNKTVPKDKQIKMSEEKALEEVVCDACQRMLLDTDAGQKLAEFGAQSKQNRGFLEDLKRWITDLLERLRNYFKGIDPDSKAAKEFAKFDENVKQILADMYVDMATEAGEKLSTIKAAFGGLDSVLQKNAEAISEDAIITEGAVVTDGEKSYSIKSMKADIAEGKMFEDLKNVCGWTQGQVNELKQSLEELVEYMTTFRDIVDMNETYGREGRRFSPYKPNSDPLYKISMDFSTLCSKRLLTQYVIENLQLRENRPMSAEEQMAIRDMLNEYRKVEKGLQVACAMCYVEAARLKSPKQMQRWLDDPEPLLRDYFGKKNKEFNDSVKNAQADFKESRGYARNAPKKDMKKADKDELDKIGPKMRSKYQVSAEEAQIIERAKSLPNSTYLTAGNLATLSETDPVIYAAYTSFVRTATRSKSLETDEPYYYGDSTRDNGNGIVVTDSFIESVNRENGMRFSSWSDWRIQHLLDYITAVIDNSVRGAAMHGYTKFGDEVRVLGKTGMMFNMSGVAGTQTGLNEDGSLSFSSTESIDVDEAVELRDEFPDTAGLQCIGVSDEHIVALLRSDIIDYVIPYHVSGLNAALRAMANIHGWDDYTGTQHAAIDKSIKLEDAVDKEHWHEEPVYSEFFVGYDTGMTGIEAMRASAEKYKQMCRDRGLTPKFNQFAKEENYWKLLIDRKMINQKTGNLIRQRAVTPTFDFNTIKAVVDKYVQNYDSGLEARALNHIVENWDSIPKRIKDLKKQGSKKAKKAKKGVDTLANQTLAAQPNGVETGKKSFSLPKMGDKKPPSTLTEQDLRDLLKKAENEELDDGTYFPVRINTPDILLEFVRAVEKSRGVTGAALERLTADNPVAIPVKKARQAIAIASEWYGEGDAHELAIDDVVGIIKKMDTPRYLVYEESTGRYVEIINYRTAHGKNAIAVVEMDDYKDEPYMNGYGGAKYSVLITLFPPSAKDRVTGLLKAKENIFYDVEKKKGNSQVTSGIRVPSVLNKLPFAPNVSQEEATVKSPQMVENAVSYSLPKGDPAPTFYSHMARVVEGMKQEKFGAASVVSMLTNPRRGVKAEEIKWSGIETWLEGKKSVTKAELLEFIEGSMLQIEEEVLDNKDRPYTEEQQKRLDEYEAKQTEIAERLADEWKKITGEEITFRAGIDLESLVVNKIIDANKEYKAASFEGRLLNKLGKDLQKVIEDNDDFGYDNWRDALRAIHRHRRDFIKNYEMSTNDKAVIVKYCNALNARNELPDKISDADTDRLRAIARETNPWNRKVMEVKHEHNVEQEKYMTNWGDYKLKGGKNYREMLFRLPGSSYSNSAMYVHWKDRTGVLAHARVQDLDTFLGKMLFIEEIQSDWHNEGHKSGYRKEGEKTDSMLRTESDEAYKEFYSVVEDMVYNNANWEDDNAVFYAHPAVVAEMFEGDESYFDQYRLTDEQRETIRSMVAEEAARQDALKTAPKQDAAPDAPFSDTYHEYVLKRLLRMAAEEGYDSIGWTSADTQMERWNPNRRTNEQMGIEAKEPNAVAFEKGYQIEYDQDIPKFLNKYGEKWGTKVGTTVLDDGTEVWSMAITDAMKESVLYEGQVSYSLPKVEDIKPDGDQIAQNIADVARMESVHSVDASKLLDSGKTLKEIYREFFDAWGENIHSEVYGDIAAKNSSMRSEIRHGSTAEKIASIEAIPAVIKDGKIVGWIEKNNGTLFRIVVAAPITIGKKPYIMGVMLQRDNQNQRLYLHDVVIEKEASEFSQDYLVTTGSSEENENLYTTTILQKVLDVKHQLNGETKDNKLPVGEDTSPRALLANAFEGIITNDIEKRNIQEYKGKVEMLNEEERKLIELRAQIKELSFAKGKRDTKKIKDLQFDANLTANRIATLDKTLLRLEASAPLQSILQREKEMAYKRGLEKNREKNKTARQQVIETREKRYAREKLQKLVIETAKWISYPSKTDVKCPDILKKPYADFLNGIDLSSKRKAAGGDPTKNDLRLTNAMDSLATALDRVMASQDPNQDTTAVLDTGYLDLPAGFVQKIREMTENIKAMMVEGEFVVNNMSAAEVRQLSQIIRTLNHAIKEVSTLYANLRFANVEALGDETMAFVDALGEIMKTSDMSDFIQWDNALPYYAFKRFGAGGESVFEGLMDAQDKLAYLAQKIFDFREKAWTDAEAKAWSEDTHTIDLPDGETLTLTTADAMSIYCLSRREQGLKHLLGGGTRVMGAQKGSKKAQDSRSLLTVKDLNAIISSLTDRQKQVAEAIQEFMSTTCSEWGNEISMKRFLTKEFTEKFYFPIESNDENLPTKDPSAQQSDLFRLLNISATKPIDPRANNEVIIRNIFDVFTGHASDMARLNAYGMPLLDYMKWLNYREKTVSDEGQVKVRGVRKSMEKAYGKAAKSYVLNLIKDVNGRPSDGGEPGILMKWMRAAKTASVGSSLRVATLQITSYPRAALVLAPRSLTLGLSKKPQIEKAKKYCGIALWKSFGFYDTNIARSIEDQMKGVKDVKQKLIELSLKGAEIGDAITWGCLWNACEYEVAATGKYTVGTEEFNQAVGKKLREVVYATQVVDSTLTRSQLMRSKRGMAQEAAAFMSEPTLSANMLMDAVYQFNAEKRRTGNAKAAWNKTGKYVGKAIAVYAIGQMAAALLESLWDAWRDDEDEEFSEKYLDALVENLALDLVPFNKIPILSDVFEAVLAMFDVGFYSSDKMSTTWLTQAVSAADAWKDVLSGNSSTTIYNALYKTVRAASSYYGVAFSGAMREVVAAWNNIAGAIDSTLKIRQYELSKSALGKELYEAILDGDTKQAASIEAQFEDQAAINSAIRSAIKASFEAGEIDANTAVKHLVSYGGMKQDDAYWKVEEWDFESESEDDFGKYDEFYEAVRTGKNLKAVIKKYTDNGVPVDRLKSQISSHFKPLYLEMSTSEKSRIKGYLLNALELCGYDRAAATDLIGEWEFESSHPELVGKITYTQYKRWQTDGQPRGISIDLYTKVAEYRDDGTSGSVKSQDEVADYINSLPISKAQKDALWCCFWKESTLKNAPWN